MLGKSMVVILITLFIGVTVSPLIENVQSCDCGDPPCCPELSGTMGENNWYVSFVTVTFNGTFNYIHYRIDGNDWINYTVPFQLDRQGIHLLEWTCDANMSNIYSVEIKIDTIPPFVSDTEIKWVWFFKWQFTIDVTDDHDNITGSGVNRVWLFYTNSFDTEPPYQFICRRCLWLQWLYDLFNPGCYLNFNAWDNAGNHLINISYS